MLPFTSTSTASNDHAIAPVAARYRGPDRRRQTAVTEAAQNAWFSLMLDEIDYGLVLLDAQGKLLHANHAARAELDAEHPLQLLGWELLPRTLKDQQALHEALEAASQRALRRLLTLGEGAGRCSVAVVPLAAPQGSAGAVLLVLSKRQMCEALSVQWFARTHKLTQTESRVLAALCNGVAPSAIASEHQVGIATVRTQIGSIREKTGATSIRDLVSKVAVLPPLVSVLRNHLGRAA
jgi:DNA-binding CsgD family transcriptional regulator